jgi:hypothetical protein
VYNRYLWGNSVIELWLVNNVPMFLSVSIKIELVWFECHMIFGVTIENTGSTSGYSAWHFIL